MGSLLDSNLCMLSCIYAVVNLAIKEKNNFSHGVASDTRWKCKACDISDTELKFFSPVFGYAAESFIFILN